MCGSSTMSSRSSYIENPGSRILKTVGAPCKYELSSMSYELFSMGVATYELRNMSVYIL